MFQMECPLDCGKMLQSEEKDGILRVYDKHRIEDHPASPAQWMKAHELIEQGKERAKAAGKRDVAKTTEK